jgi:nucleoid-associated protein YgaU
MASEAKIGLLLGLVIIFVIAFVLNELPRFGEVADNGPSGGSEADNSPGIGALERDHIETNKAMEPTGRKTDPPPSEPDHKQSEIARIPLPAAPAVPEPPTGQTQAVESARQTLSAVYYTVAEGDNLADIAKKFYGPFEGNRRINVLRIFEANHQLLASPHEILVGQRLVIPPLRASEPDGVEIARIFPSSMFDKVKSIGMRHLSADNHKPLKSRRYVVRQGDNLWRVASAQLGDGSRYREISRLNAGTLKDEDRLTVGMHLNLPAQ